MKRLLFSSLLLSTLLLSACSPFKTISYTTTSSGNMPAPEYAASDSVASSMGGAYFGEKANEAPLVSGVLAPTEDRKVIKTGSLSLHVDSVLDAIPTITQLVTDEGGNVDSSNITRGSNSYTGNMTVRVPSDKFDESMAALKAQAVYVDSEYTNASDVTEYYTDLQTRLTNKQAEEAQYLDVLKQAQTVTDILSVDQYLSNVRYEIESLQGQIKSYDGQIDESTISIYLTEDESVSAVSETWKPVSTIRTALSDWVVFLQGGVNGLIYLAIFGWPLLIVFLVVRVYLRRNRKPSKK